MSRTDLFVLAALATMATGSMAIAQSSQRVTFRRGNDNTSVSGSIAGHQYRDYLVGARAGQRLGVSLITKGNAYFNVLPPASGDVAMYNSSSDGNDASGLVLPKTGDYRIRVYLLGAAMRSSKPIAYQLSIMVM